MQVSKHFVREKDCSPVTINSQYERKRKRNEWSNLSPANTVREQSNLTLKETEWNEVVAQS